MDILKSIRRKHSLYKSSLIHKGDGCKIKYKKI